MQRRPDIEWYFHSKAAADAAQDLFRQVPDLAGSKSIICRVRGIPTECENQMTSSPILIPYDFARVFHLRVLGPRAEPPEAIAPHYLACIDRLKQVHPAYDNWIFHLKGKPKNSMPWRETR